MHRTSAGGEIVRVVIRALVAALAQKPLASQSQAKKRLFERIVSNDEAFRIYLEEKIDSGRLAGAR